MARAGLHPVTLNPTASMPIVAASTPKTIQRREVACGASPGAVSRRSVLSGSPFSS